MVLVLACWGLYRKTDVTERVKTWNLYKWLPDMQFVRHANSLMAPLSMANLISAADRTPENFHFSSLHKRRDPEDWQEKAQHPQARWFQTIKP